MAIITLTIDKQRELFLSEVNNRETISAIEENNNTYSVVDPGFPVGGANLIGGANSWGSYVSKKLYVETKESGPLGGGHAHQQRPLDLPMVLSPKLNRRVSAGMSLDSPFKNHFVKNYHYSFLQIQ